MAITKVYGRWPTFHDAEVKSITLQRGPGEPFMDCSIHLFEMTSDISPSGHYVTTKHNIVVLRFSGIILYELKWFNAQNVIDGLDIQPAENGEGRLAVYLPSNSGAEARFNCDSVRIVSIEPYTSEQRVRDGSIYASH